MKRALLVSMLIVVLALVAVAPAFAAGPCDDQGLPGHSDYAQGHIVPLGKAGNLGAPQSGHLHTPGSHHGYSACL